MKAVIRIAIGTVLLATAFATPATGQLCNPLEPMPFTQAEVEVAQ